MVLNEKSLDLINKNFILSIRFKFIFAKIYCLQDVIVNEYYFEHNYQEHIFLNQLKP